MASQPNKGPQDRSGAGLINVARVPVRGQAVTAFAASTYSSI
jgi:hypothetical protein